MDVVANMDIVQQNYVTDYGIKDALPILHLSEN